MNSLFHSAPHLFQSYDYESNNMADSTATMIAAAAASPTNSSDAQSLPSSARDKTLLPESFQPTDCDVIVGRGREVYWHEGNQRFRGLVQSRLADYANTNSRVEKSYMIQEIVERVRAMGGAGFVKKSSSSKTEPNAERWFKVGDDVAKEKTSQAFRDFLHEIYSSSNEAKKKVRRGKGSKYIRRKLCNKTYADNGPPRAGSTQETPSVSSLSTSASRNSQLFDLVNATSIPCATKATTAQKTSFFCQFPHEEALPSSASKSPCSSASSVSYVKATTISGSSGFQGKPFELNGMESRVHVGSEVDKQHAQRVSMEPSSNFPIVSFKNSSSSYDSFFSSPPALQNFNGKGLQSSYGYEPSVPSSLDYYPFQALSRTEEQSPLEYAVQRLSALESSYVSSVGLTSNVGDNNATTILSNSIATLPATWLEPLPVANMSGGSRNAWESLPPQRQTPTAKAAAYSPLLSLLTTLDAEEKTLLSDLARSNSSV